MAIPRRNWVKTKALSPKRQRFVEEYLIDCNATQAAIRAGYSPNTALQQGSRLLTYVDVQAAIASGLANIKSKSIADATELREFWTSMMRDPLSDPKDRLKASDLMGKASAMFVERREITGKDGAPLLDADVIRRMAKEIAGHD